MVQKILNWGILALFGPFWPKRALPVVWWVYIMWNTNRNLYTAVILRGQPTLYDKWFRIYIEVGILAFLTLLFLRSIAAKIWNSHVTSRGRFNEYFFLGLGADTILTRSWQENLIRKLWKFGRPYLRQKWILFDAVFFVRSDILSTSWNCNKIWGKFSMTVPL